MSCIFAMEANDEITCYHIDAVIQTQYHTATKECKDLRVGTLANITIINASYW